MTFITGTFKLIKSENYEEYLDALGVNIILKRMASCATPITEISQNGDDWKIKTRSTFKTTEIKFKLGQEFDEITSDGRHCKSTIMKEGENTLVHTQKCDGTTVKMTHEFTNDQMKVVLQAPGNIISTRFFKKL